ncbi:hypothetical protein ACFWA5_49855 [Streptomyces mirabilis]
MAGLPWLPQTGKALLGWHVSTLHPLGGGCEPGHQDGIPANSHAQRSLAR